MPGDVQRIQLARILGLDSATLTIESARQEIASRPSDLADAFFREAADNDDVTGRESALDYLESRMTDFADLIPPDAAAAVRAAFREHLRAWDRESETPTTGH